MSSHARSASADAAIGLKPSGASGGILGLGEPASTKSWSKARGTPLLGQVSNPLSPSARSRGPNGQNTVDKLGGTVKLVSKNTSRLKSPVRATGLTRVAEEHTPRNSPHQEALAAALCTMEDSVRSLYEHGPAEKRRAQAALAAASDAAALAASTGGRSSASIHPKMESLSAAGLSVLAGATGAERSTSSPHRWLSHVRRQSSRDSSLSDGNLTDDSRSTAAAGDSNPAHNGNGSRSRAPSRWLSAVLVDQGAKSKQGADDESRAAAANAASAALLGCHGSQASSRASKASSRASKESPSPAKADRLIEAEELEAKELKEGSRDFKEWKVSKEEPADATSKDASAEAIGGKEVKELNQGLDSVDAGGSAVSTPIAAAPALAATS